MVLANGALEGQQGVAQEEFCIAVTAEAFEETRGLGEWARRHHVIVARFGRFPHRNAVLGRTSTPEEVEAMKGPMGHF